MDYIHLEQLAAHFAAQINLTRQYFTCREPLDTSDYFDEVFHLGAIYHRIFPFPRLIVLDLDLEFQNVDIADLESQFDRMDPQSLMSIAYDQSPHYWYFFREFRQSQSSAGIQQPIRVRKSLSVFLTFY